MRAALALAVLLAALPRRRARGEDLLRRRRVVARDARGLAEAAEGELALGPRVRGVVLVSAPASAARFSMLGSLAPSCSDGLALNNIGMLARSTSPVQLVHGYRRSATTKPRGCIALTRDTHT